MPELELKRSEDFRSVYSNHVQFRSGLLEMKLDFSEIDAEVLERVTVTLPWALAKLFSYRLILHVLADGATIPVPPQMLPSRPDPSALDPSAKATIEALGHLYDRMFGAAPVQVAASGTEVVQ